jgi:hypothetical protein
MGGGSLIDGVVNRGASTLDHKNGYTGDSITDHYNGSLVASIIDHYNG